MKGLVFSKYTIRTNPRKTMMMSKLTREDFYQCEVNTEYLDNVNNEVEKMLVKKLILKKIPFVWYLVPGTTLSCFKVVSVTKCKAQNLEKHFYEVLGSR